MTKSLVKLIYSLLFIWSVASLQISLNIFDSNDGYSIYRYISIVCLLFIESISVLLLVSNLRKILFTKLSFYILLWIIYITINVIGTSENVFIDLREVLWWPLVFLLFYIISINDHNGNYIDLLTKYLKIIFFTITIQYFIIRYQSALNLTIKGDEIYGASNLIFYISLLFPFSFLYDRKLKYTILIIGFVAVLISFKRSAITYSVLVLLLAIYTDFIESKKKNFIKSLFIASFLISLFYITFINFEQRTEGYISSRFKNIEEDKGSGRLDIYVDVLNEFQTKSILEKLLGSGQNAVRKDNIILVNKMGTISSLSAHNDFIEILYDFGIIGLLLYFKIIYHVSKNILILRKINKQYYYANVAAFIIFLIMSFVSHLIIYATYFAYIVILWSISDVKRHTKKY